jgi:dUTP pyrophosphatase
MRSVCIKLELIQGVLKMIKRSLGGLDVIANDHLLIPSMAYADDACADLFCPEDITLPCGVPTKIGLQITFDMPSYVYGLILGRSSLALKGVQVLGGVIDPSFKGEVCAILLSFASEPIQLEKYQAIAQLAIMTLHTGKYFANRSSDRQRGTMGFGSSNSSNFTYS